MKYKNTILGALVGVFLVLTVWMGVSYRNQYVSIDGRKYSIEKASTDEERARGLGGRDVLCRSCTMLFVFDYPGRHAFWMKEMHFPLDIVWLSGDKIVSIKHRIAEDSQEIFSPDRDADTVLEFNAGEMDSVSVGDKVEFSSY